MTDLQAMGAPAEVIAEQRQRQRAELFDVLPENWTAVGLFLRCQSQWRYAPSGRPSGLDYSGVDVLLRRGRVDDADSVFEQIQVMETAYLNQLSD